MSPLRWTRFAVYGALSIAALAIQAGPVKHTLMLLASPLRYSPRAPCLPCALLIAVAVAAYVVWLSGATVAGWRMGWPPHVAMLALLGFGAVFGPLPEIPSKPLPADSQVSGPEPRALLALSAVDQALAVERNPCGPAGLSAAARALDAPKVPDTGFRRFGRPVPFSLRPQKSGAPLPTTPLPGDTAGTLYLTCADFGFRLSAVALSRSTRGQPIMLVDGTGQLAVLQGGAGP